MFCHLVATTFEDHVCGTKTHGFRIYDEYEAYYDNNSESPINDDIELLEYALSVDDADIKGLFDCQRELQSGITINNQFYDWEEIKDLF
jgi:hypothetical protein